MGDKPSASEVISRWQSPVRGRGWAPEVQEVDGTQAFLQNPGLRIVETLAASRRSAVTGLGVKQASHSHFNAPRVTSVPSHGWNSLTSCLV